MHNIWVIARREYLERIRAKSFLLMTILIPLLMGGIIWGTALLNGHRSVLKRIAVVTPDAQLGVDIKADLASEGDKPVAVQVVSPSPDRRTSLDGELKAGDLDGYLWVRAAQSVRGRETFELASTSRIDGDARGAIRSAIQYALACRSLRHSGVPSPESDQLLQPVEIIDSQPADGPGRAAVSAAYVLFFLMYYVIIAYCMNIGRSIIDDKSSRVYEVMLATVRPSELMAGKLIGIGAVGLTQLVIWAVAGVGTAAYGLLGSDVSIPLTFLQVVYFVVFFVLGYMLYSSIASALGAMVSSQQELQQMNILLMTPLFVCNAVIVQVVRNPDSTMATIVSLFPFCTPLIMYVRIAVHQPPVWQIGLSILGMIVTIFAVVWLAARIYRVGILMYGKRPTMPELVRWLRYT